jgi:hypothetical protein
MARSFPNTERIPYDLLRQAEQMVALVEDWRVSFPNNQTGRDLCLLKVPDKIAGAFRSQKGGLLFVGSAATSPPGAQPVHAMLDALGAIVVGMPFPVTWGT